MKKQLNRRRFLTGVGGLALALPWLERFAPRADAAPVPNGPKRIIVVTYQMGIPGGRWRPSATGSAFTLPYVTAPLEPFRDRCLFISDFDNTMLSLRTGLAADDTRWSHGHPGKTESALTGTFTSNAFPLNTTNHVNELNLNVDMDKSTLANAASVEHVIGQQLFAGQPWGSVDLLVRGDLARMSKYSIEEKFQPHNSRFFFEGRRNPVGMEWRPRVALDRYFAQIAPPGDTQAIAALRALRERNKSVLDAVRESYAQVAVNLGSDDRYRLDEHASRIRQLELDITPTSGSPPADGDIGTGLLGQNMTSLAAWQIKLLAHAMWCDVAPVGRLEFNHQQEPRFGITSVDTAFDSSLWRNAGFDWHAMVHGNVKVPGTASYPRPGKEGGTTYDQRLLDGYRFFVQQFANLLAALDGFTEGTGKVLDNSLVVLATDFGEGLAHHHGKMGMIVAGNLGGARRNYHYRCATSSALYTTSKYELLQVLNSICDMAGVTKNGAPMSFGLQGYLAKMGRPRRIDGLFA